MMAPAVDDRTEWLEADGLGGFASGTVSGIRTRRYHALLLPAVSPPTGRMALVNGVDAWIDTAAASVALTTQRYAPDVLHPDGSRRIVAFASEPWPTWTYALADGSEIVHELFVERGTGLVALAWTVRRAASDLRLRVRPFLSGRDYHAIHRENGSFRFEPVRAGAAIRFQPYDGVPATVASSNGEYVHEPDWYRRFFYTAEAERGLDAVEDLASPGEFVWTLTASGTPAVLLFNATGHGVVEARSAAEVVERWTRARAAEAQRRAAFASALDRAADAYLVERGTGSTIVAGYPWFTDWGRDTFISVRGLCLASGRLEDARDILIEWADTVSEGMLPNRFPDHGEQSEFNAVDASLWYVVAAGELLAAAKRRRSLLASNERAAIERAILAIVAGYARGTRFGIRMDADGLLAAGVPGVQLTWMDARVGDRVITPRIGKPVEVQALWINALAVASELDANWRESLARAREAFPLRFWVEELGALADVVDVDHVPGTRDLAFRPNQILAVGGLPHAVVDGPRAAQIVAGVERRLLTPLGLRSLAPGEPGYAGHYAGDPSARDAVYHQGTVWPWLMGAFVDAWLRTHGNTAESREEARQRFVAPLRAHLEAAGLGHVSEIADAEPPFTPRGCPFQAWSLGELMRIERSILVEPARRARRVKHRRTRAGAGIDTEIAAASS
jgi:predicted glycogen debranching enzyme